ILTNAAMIEGRLDEAAALAKSALEAEAATDAAPLWPPRSSLALLSAAGVIDGEARTHLRALEELTGLTGNPMPAAVATFDRALITSFTERRTRAAAAAENLVELGRSRHNPTLTVMG